MNNASGTAAPGFQFHRHGILFVVSAPSGAGKSTILNSIRPAADFVYSISCTTRAPRAGEIDGEDYHFTTHEKFRELIAAGEFLEWAEVHGNLYGTRRDLVLQSLKEGVDVMVDIDVQGARSIRACEEVRASLADIFIMPPSLEELHHRLAKRGTETEAQIAMRMANAQEEIQAWSEYRYTIISGSMEEDLQKFRAIMRAERYLSRRMLKS